ncbi:hypothetical protein FIU89_21160 (plasmid) [Roseovarius sp. THAF27]|nr:hypothetical protein FIU89_21160 [Roseovarius sp. THAF27]QFT99684.1 hypothetical protein FIU85_20370 [Roseovarius sp. THAF8]
MKPLVELKPLKISCTDSDCDNGLHCFKTTRQMGRKERGSCRSCGAKLIDWPRLHKRSIEDAEFTFEALRNEKIRHHFFHVEIDQRAKNYAKRKGWLKLREAVESRIRKYVAKAGNPRDGRQTPFEDNPIFYAQHATATCCRTCLNYWHDISKGHDLTDEEVDYCADLIEMYLRERLDDVEDGPQRVPPIRSKIMG